MANWDELGEKFNRDRESARLDKLRATQEHKLVENKGPALWKSLQDEVSSAVTAINKSYGNILTLVVGPDPISGRTGFEIIYNREGEQRKASANFSSLLNTLTVKVEQGRQIPYHETLKIIATNDNEVAFSSNGPCTPETIVRDMLSRLL